MYFGLYPCQSCTNKGFLCKCTNLCCASAGIRGLPPPCLCNFVDCPALQGPVGAQGGECGFARVVFDFCGFEPPLTCLNSLPLLIDC